MRRVIVLLIGLTLASLPARAEAAEAAADKTALHVLFVSSERAHEAARALTLSLKRAVRQSGRYRLGKGEYSVEVLTATLDCTDPPNQDCQRRIAQKLETTAYVWGRLTPSGGELVADLHLWQDGAERGRTSLRYPADFTDPNGEALRRLASGALSELSGVRTGILSVMAGTAEGFVFVGGEPAGDLKHGLAELRLPAGVHELAVRAHGYEEARARVEVVSGKRHELLVPLTRRARAADAVVEPSRDDGDSDMRRTAGYVGLAAGGALLTGGVYASLRSDPDTLGVVLMGAGALAAGAGLYLLVTTPDPAAVRVRPELTVGPRLARVGLGLHF